MTATGPNIKRPKRSKTLGQPVQRAADSAGRALPTAKELDLLRELGRRWGIDLPSGYRQDLAFVRAFLDVFAFDGARNPREQIVRRLRNARQLAWDGVAGEDIARKLDVPLCLGPVLRAYGLAQVPQSWRVQGEAEKAAPQATVHETPSQETVVDRLTEAMLDGDDSAWAEFATPRDA